MPTVDLETLPNEADLKQVVRHLIRQHRQLTYLLSHLDEENVKGLSAGYGTTKTVHVTREMVKVAYSNTNNIEMVARPDGLNAPRLLFNNGVYSGSLGMSNNIFQIKTTGNSGATFTSMLLESRSLQMTTVDGVQMNGGSLRVPNASVPLRSYSAPSSSATEVADIVSAFNTAMSYLRSMGIFS